MFKTIEREGFILSKLKSKLIMLFVLVFAFGILASGCNLIEKSPEAIAKQKVAKVGQEYITRAQLDEEFAPALEQIKAQYGDNYLTSDDGKTMAANQKKQILDMMVDNLIFAQKAKEFNLFKDEKEIDDEVKKYVDDLMKMYNMDEDQFNKQLEQAKMTKEIFNKRVKEQAIIPQKVYENTVKDVTVGDDEIQKFYDENKASMTEKPNTMEVSHILLDSEDKAKEVKAELDKGGDFAAIAKEKSTEPDAKESGGSLGEIQYNDPGYDPTFVQAAMALNEGQISDPVLTQFGYHIIKVTKKNEYPVLALDKVKDQIKDQLSGEKKEKLFSDTMKEWKDKAGVKIYESNMNNMK